MKLWEYIKDEMLKYPEQVICEGTAEITYEEMIIYAEVFAKKLKGEKCCAIVCVNEMASAIALLSCFVAGVTAVPLSIRYGSSSCNKILELIKPSAAIVDMNGELEVIYLEDKEYVIPDQHPALIMCTSGTTGRPKGVMLSENNIISNVNDISEYFKISHHDSILISRPLYHCAVLTGEFLTALRKGIRICFYSDAFNPQKLLTLIKKLNITVFCGTPTMLTMMSRYKRKNSEISLKAICISGECLSDECGLKIADSFPEADIYHVYGLTEACPRVSYLPPDQFRKHPSSVGIPLKSVEIKIIPEGNSEGLLWIKGGNIMMGYYNDPELTKKTMCDDWLCTGDIAEMDDNYLKIKGRLDGLIIRAGMNIYPAEIENAVKVDPRVKEVVVYGMNQKDLTMQICMKIAGDFKDVGEVRQMCALRLPSHQMPSCIELVKELPKNGSGKIIRGCSNV